MTGTVRDITEFLSGPAMRCYFLKDGHIAAVELLKTISDADRIAESRELFKIKGKPRGADGFEVWDRRRFIYRYPELPKT
jgi:hypothetical protein